MSASEIFTLNNSIAPRLIRILYVVMLVLIALAVIAGVARGIATIARPPQQRVAVMGPPPAGPAPQAAAQTPASEPATPPAPNASQSATPAPSQGPATAPATPPAPQTAPMPPRGPRFAFGRGFRGERFGPARLGPGARVLVRNVRGGGRNAVFVGTFQIVRALVAGLIAVLVVRILAEMSLAVLTMGEKAKS